MEEFLMKLTFLIMNRNILLLFACITTLFLYSCKEEIPEPYNPYNDIVYPIDDAPEIDENPNSLGRHIKRFLSECNVLGCR